MKTPGEIQVQHFIRIPSNSAGRRLCSVRMKFGEAYSEYLDAEDDRFLQKCRHLEYKELKNVLKKCSHAGEAPDHVDNEICPVCGQNFFSELSSEISDIADCFSSRARHILHLHLASAFHKYLRRVSHCFGDDYLAMIQEGQNLINYVAMNSIAVHKILKKYDKVHCSENGQNFRRILQAKHLELLQSPWLIELSAFQLNTKDTKHGAFSEEICKCSCDFSGSEPIIMCTLSEIVKVEFSLTCSVCLDIVFEPVALGCGHLFCNSCACNAASVPLIEGVKNAKSQARCPLCRQSGVYADSVHLAEMNLLVKKRCKKYWKERFYVDRAERMKEAKDYWDVQRNFVLGFI
ncbi:probable E3 ubiquitin-protein ligase BAH1-like isoform X1 [Cryptomeria japonica]|uniref:probable E3 ubiquitin-protein ligase BAH1-like isoform X1 n=2 Tax=Cryptomeria japonica TaxID=3369 RepID=UPI0025AC7BDF|nr:probable E3 ubiquitin-protein ligase BAH1-like isoform X1 [Cryptomeria japonica]